MNTARPYRSHRYPACARCRQLRVRCVVEVQRPGCSRCKKQGASCSLADAFYARPRVDFIHRSELTDNQSLDYRTRILGPVVARDTHMLHRYVSHGDGAPFGVLIKPAQNEGQSHRPIYHVPLPPRIPGPSGCQCPKNRVRLLLDTVEPFLEILISGYFEHLDPCYPLADEDCIMTRLKDRNNLPETFLLLLVSYALFYWDLIPGLSTYTRPNQDFACYISVASITATTDEGDMATVSALCLGVSGRPWRRLVHNAVGVARAVAVAHTMGLNHDCSGWNIKDLEKRMRWKVWWAVLILDQWSSFAQGTPTYISKGQYDVPLPTMDILLTRKRAQSTNHIRAAEVYLQLCRLTEILGDILPLIYQIHTSTNVHNTASRLSGLNGVLDQWVDNLPHWLNMSDFHERPFVPGLANLQLSYLSVRMLVRRIAWHDAIRTQSDKSCLSSLLSLCQTAAENIVRFVSLLQRRDLIAFWLPYNAQHFTSAVTLLLCCALQTNNSSTRSKCMMGARTLVDSLHRHRNENDWDLSELCLSQSEAVLKRMEEALPRLLLNNTLTSIAGPPNIPDHDTEAGSRIVDGMNNGGTSAGYIGTEDGEPTSLAALFPELFRDLSSENFDVTQYDSMYSIFDS